MEELQGVAAFERRRRRQANLLAGAAVVGFLVAGIVGIWAWGQKREADRQKASFEAAIQEGDAYMEKGVICVAL